MLTINLLPPQQKKAVRLEEWRRLMRFFCFGAMAALAIGTILTLPSYLPLLLRRNELARSLLLEEDAAKRMAVRSTQERIRATRALIDSVGASALDAPRASPLFEEWAGDTHTVTILNLAVRKNGDVLLNGHAASRRDLLNFEKTLRESGRFQEIAFPLSNIVREANITFTMRGVLKPQYRL